MFNRCQIQPINLGCQFIDLSIESLATPLCYGYVTRISGAQQLLRCVSALRTQLVECGNDTVSFLGVRHGEGRQVFDFQLREHASSSRLNSSEIAGHQLAIENGAKAIESQ